MASSSYKACIEVTPESSKNPKCPNNCVGCEYFAGIKVFFDCSMKIECELEDNED